MGFKKVDLHIHSSSDYSREKDFTEKEFLERLREIEENQLLDVISITDHNIIDIELYKKIDKLLTNTIVFPGFEINLELKDYLKEDFGIALNTNREYFHAIVIIHPDDIEKASNYLENLFGEMKPGETFPDYSRRISKNKIDINDFFIKYNDVRYYFIPHENKGSKNRNLKYQFHYPKDRQEIVDNNNNFIYSLYFMGNVGLDGKVKLKNDMYNNKGLSEELFKIYEERVAYFLFSDNKTLNEISSKYTWINFNGNFEDLILAFSSVESRIKSSSETTENPQKNIGNYVEKITYGGGKEIKLSPGLNCIVGSRGSGKSSLMRALDQEKIGNLIDLELHKHGNKISNINKNLLYINQESLKKIYDDVNNIDLKNLPLISDIKELYIDKVEKEHDDEIIKLEQSFDKINTEVIKFLSEYSKKKFYYITNFMSNDNNIEKIKKANNLLKYNNTKKNFNEKIEELKSLFKLSIEANYEEENKIQEKFKEYTEIINEFKKEIQGKILEDNIENILNESLSRYENVEKYNASVSKINMKYNSEVTAKLEEYQQEKEYLLSLNKLRKLINKEVKLITAIEENLRNNGEVDNLPNNENLEQMGIKLEVNLGINVENDKVITKFQKSNTSDGLIEFYEHILLSSEIKESFKNLGTKSKVIKEILEAFKCKYVEELNSQSEYSIDLIDINSGKEFVKLSPGTRAELLLKLILNYEINDDKVNLIMLDQPDDDLDNKTIKDVLVNSIKKLKLEKQILIVSHSANVVVNGDADNIILANVEENNNDLKFNYEYGSLTTENIRKEAIELLDGGKELMIERFNKYNFKMEE